MAKRKTTDAAAEKFKEFVRNGEPFFLLKNPFGKYEKEEYDAETLISMYYEYGHRCLGYDSDGYGFSFDTDAYRSKSFFEIESDAEDEINRNMKKWKKLNREELEELLDELLGNHADMTEILAVKRLLQEK